MITKDDVLLAFNSGIMIATSLTIAILFLKISPTTIATLNIIQSLAIFLGFGYWVVTGFVVNKFLKFYIKIK